MTVFAKRQNPLSLFAMQAFKMAKMLRCYGLILSLLVFLGFNWDGQQYAANSKSQEFVAQQLISKINLKGSENILDVGCGDGKISKQLSDLVPNGKVVGIDFSDSQIQFAKQLETKNLKFVKEDAQTLAYENTFDVAVSFSAMQWVPNQVKAYKAIHRALKPGGKLYVTVPMGITWQLEESVQRVIKEPEWRKFPYQNKQFFFPREAYAQNVITAGFTIEGFEIFNNFRTFDTVDQFSNFVRQWLPYVQDVPENRRDAFMNELMKTYVKLHNTQKNGKVFFENYYYNLVASK